MSWSSSSSPLRGAEVWSSRRPWEAGRDKIVGSSSHPAAPLACVGPARHPAEWALPSRRDSRPVRSIPQGGQRSDRCPSARSMMARTVRTPTPCRGAGRGGGRRIRHRRRARRRWRNRALPRGTYSRCLSEVAGPRMFTCPLSQEGAMVQPRSLWRPEGQPPSEWGRMLPL
jgi:hypothetical protein